MERKRFRVWLVFRQDIMYEMWAEDEDHAVELALEKVENGVEPENWDLETYFDRDLTTVYTSYKGKIE